MLSQFNSVQFSSLSRVRLFETPWAEASKASLSITNSWSLLKLIFAHKFTDVTQLHSHFIDCLARIFFTIYFILKNHKFSIACQTLCFTEGVSFALETVSGPWEEEQNMECFTNLRVILAQGPC